MESEKTRNRSGKFERVRDHLRPQIEQNKFAPGERLPTHAELAKQFRINKMTVNRAMRELARQGLVVQRQGRGTYVADREHAPVAQAGADEVARFYPQYTATYTDRRLFIHDPGNRRIVSVKLGCHAEERAALKDVRNRRKD
jgi:DNA-binding GntR family transcriptional regulator